jgi:hypothetical protein
MCSGAPHRSFLAVGRPPRSSGNADLRADRIDTCQRYVDKIVDHRHIELACRRRRHASKAQFSAEKPYNALPQLPPKAELETKPVMKALREVKAGREKLFIHPNLMKLLTAEDHTVLAYRGRAASSWPETADNSKASS